MNNQRLFWFGCLFVSGFEFILSWFDFFMSLGAKNIRPVTTPEMNVTNNTKAKRALSIFQKKKWTGTGSAFCNAKTMAIAAMNKPQASFLIRGIIGLILRRQINPFRSFGKPLPHERSRFDLESCEITQGWQSCQRRAFWKAIWGACFEAVQVSSNSRSGL